MGRYSTACLREERTVALIFISILFGWLVGWFARRRAEKSNKWNKKVEDKGTLFFFPVCLYPQCLGLFVLATKIFHEVANTKFWNWMDSHK